jgi:hypothetical protein
MEKMERRTGRKERRDGREEGEEGGGAHHCHRRRIAAGRVAAG